MAGLWVHLAMIEAIRYGLIANYPSAFIFTTVVMILSLLLTRLYVAGVWEMVRRSDPSSDHSDLSKPRRIEFGTWRDDN